MEDDGQRPSNSASTSDPSSSSSSTNRGAQDVPSTSSSSQVEERQEEVENNEDEDRRPEFEPPPLTTVSYRIIDTLTDEASPFIRDDTWSCAIVLITFWFFVSMTLILGVYGSINIHLSPNTSILLQPNPLFVEYLKVEELDQSKYGPVLYGFSKQPPLDVITNWSETHTVSLASYTDKEWNYYLNQGSQVNISYTVNSSSSESLILVIAQGDEGLEQWLEDPSYPNITLSWNIIHGSGTIQQEIWQSSTYYIAVGNLNSDNVEVEITVEISAVLYNTSEAYHKCFLIEGTCNLKLFFPSGNVAVLTSPGPEMGVPSNGWYVRLSYGPRWITYIVGIGGMTLLMMLAFNFLSKLQCSRTDGGFHVREPIAERTPLLTNKDDDLLSWGSSYDSVSNDEEDLEESLAAGSSEVKMVKDGDNNPRRLCAICFDAPRDCFFLPCGHCAACFTCGTRIVELDGNCPICRRKMKKVRRIYTV
ncbi:protein of unknown function DUF4792 [Dillenia turbinata]|uniref:RING-type domain-containing protein n=1 Tax=Dillenia turbinata TaxID=194707 RepID=A0AAN8ZMQ0_9MAGN